MPLSEEPETLALPEADAVQFAPDPVAPPAGTDSEKVTLLPDTVPDTVPVAFVPSLLSVSDRVPENEVPDWVSTHVMSPEPEESVAVPDHEPVTLAVVVVVEGVEELGVVGELPPPLQAALNTRHRSAPARAPVVR